MDVVSVTTGMVAAVGLLMVIGMDRIMLVHVAVVLNPTVGVSPQPGHVVNWPRTETGPKGRSLTMATHGAVTADMPWTVTDENSEPSGKSLIAWACPLCTS
jgi:hypothetical protein